jgi:hypothetical protein
MEIHCTTCETSLEVSSTQMSNRTATVSCECGAEVVVSQARPVAPLFRLVGAPEEQIAPPAAAEPPPVQESTPAPLPVKNSATPRPRPNTETPRPTPRVTSLAAAAPSTTGRPGSWRSCVNHPRVRSEEMCPACAVGYCVECKKAVCSKCDGVCMPTNEYAGWQVRERQRARSMRDELSTILCYPLQDRLAFIVLAMFTGLFAFAARFTVYAVPFSQGILLWYSFHSLYQVAKGNMRRAMPEFNDISDLYRPLRLSGGVLLIGWAPALLLMAVLGSSLGLGGLIWGQQKEPAPIEQPAQTERETEQDTAVAGLLEVFKETGGEEEGALAAKNEEEASPSAREVEVTPPQATTPATATEYTFGLSLLIGLVLAWKVAYTPVALIVAALSSNLWSIVNPLIGVDTIKRMGPVYMQVMLIYSGFAAARWAVGSALGYVLPLTGGVVMSFVDAYFYLAVGCLLGLAVFKRANELGWD